MTTAACHANWRRRAGNPAGIVKTFNDPAFGGFLHASCKSAVDALWLHGLLPHRGRDLAACALHCRPPATRSRGLLHRRFRSHSYNAETFDTSNDDYTTPPAFSRAWPTNLISKSLVVLRVIYRELPTAGLPLRRIRQLCKSADAIFEHLRHLGIQRRSAGERSVLYIEERSRCGTNQSRSGVRVNASTISGRHRALFTFGEHVGTKRFPVPIHGLEVAPNAAADSSQTLKTQRPPPAGAVFTSIANWSTSGLKDITWRGEKISLE